MRTLGISSLRRGNAGEGPATSIQVEYSDSTTSNWEWDEELEQYLHFQGTEPHEWVTEDGDTGQVRFDTIVVMKMRKYIARNPAGSGTSLPTVETCRYRGGRCLLRGQAVTGTWERETSPSRSPSRPRMEPIWSCPQAGSGCHSYPTTDPVTWE